MESTATSQPSISTLFAQSQDMFSQIEKSSLNSTDPQYQKQVTMCLNNFKSIALVLIRNHVFSSNEELEDINTSALKLILVHYYIAELHLKLVDSERISNLKYAKGNLSSFLRQCEQLKLLHKDDINSLHRDIPVDAKTKREEKINRARRDKEINSKLQEILQKKKESMDKYQSGNITSSVVNEEETDEEEQRDFYILLIKTTATKALDSIDTVEQELDMLQQIENIKLQNNGKVPPPKDPPKSNLPYQNFTIVNSRDKLKQGVFKPGNLPTMTPEEWAELQIKNGTLPTASGTTKPNKPKDDEISAEEEEEKRQKDSKFDDWKDENPKGQGNKNDRYFKR